MGGALMPLDANVIVRWDTQDREIKEGRKDEIIRFRFELSCGLGLGLQGQARSASLSCFTNQDQAIAHFITSRPANPDIGSSEAFAKAKTWLAECVDGHTKCQQIFPESSVMPTRVLEISMSQGDKYSIKLHESGAEIGSYAALSHMWGGDQKSKTLKTNIKQHMRQIDSKKLPRTIMDAVRCTQKLGLKYLWVDSLCIIQDSENDQEKEIGHMSEIYKNSYVTISAAKAKSPVEGFLEPKTAVEDPLKSSFKLELLTPKDPVALNEWIDQYRIKRDFSNFMLGSEIEDDFKASVWNSASAWYDMPSTIFLAARTPGQGDKDDPLAAVDVKEEPISTRGWTLQEYWLSSRMLIYGCAQLLWICRRKVQVDGGIKGSNSNVNIRNSYRIDERGKMIYDDGSRVTDPGREFIFRSLWQDLVQESTRRTLTVSEDKLNTLEGIVQELRLQTGDEYLAGVWRKHLVSELSWYQYDPRKGSQALKCNKERTCPSWSWIKTDGPVSFSHAENSNVEVQYARILRNEKVSRRLIVDGYLRLLAPMSILPLSECALYFICQYPGSPRRAFTNMIFPDGGFENGVFEVDIINGEKKTSAPPDMRFLELSWGKQDGSQDIANESRGLVLVSANIEELPEVFRRVGFWVVALEEGLEKKRGKLVSMLGFGPEAGIVTATEFGKVWKANLKVEEVTII